MSVDQAQEVVNDITNVEACRLRAVKQYAAALLRRRSGWIYNHLSFWQKVNDLIACEFRRRELFALNNPNQQPTQPQ